MTFFAFFVFLPVSASALRRLEGFCGGRGAGVDVVCTTSGLAVVFFCVWGEVLERREEGFRRGRGGAGVDVEVVCGTGGVTVVSVRITPFLVSASVAQRPPEIFGIAESGFMTFPTEKHGNRRPPLKELCFCFFATGLPPSFFLFFSLHRTGIGIPYLSASSSRC